MTRPHPDTSFNRLPFVYLLIPLIAGILAACLFPAIRFSWLLILFAGLFVVCSSLLFIKQFTRSRSFLTSLLFYSLLFLSGMLLTHQKDVTRNSHWIGHVASESSFLLANVTEQPKVKAKTIQLSLNVKQARCGNRWQSTFGEIIIYLSKKNFNGEIKKGDLILFPNKLTKITNRGNPFEFNYAGYLHRQGIYYQAFLLPKEIMIIEKEQSRVNVLDKLKSHLLQSVKNNIHDTATAALTEAMLLNERTQLDNNIWKAYSVTGIAHIIAISGMHVSLLFSILLVLLWWIKAPRLRWIKYLFGLPFIWAYIAITGFPPSAVRAAVMFSILFICLFLRKDQNPINSLAATAFLLLCYNPYWVFDTGIQLSFAAVASIFLFFKPIYQLYQSSNKIITYLWSAVSVSLAAQILVFPIVIYYFHQFPVWFLLANIPASLYSLILMILALLLFVLSGVGVPCVWLGNWMTLLTDNFHGLIFFLAKHTPESMRQLYLSGSAFWLLLLIVVLFCLYIFFKKRFYLFSGLAFSALLLLLLDFTDYQTLKQQKIIVYNSNHHSLIDYVEGQKYASFGESDSLLDVKTIQYTLLPSRLGHHAKKYTRKAFEIPIQYINHKRILVLNQSGYFNSQNKFPIDYLIVSTKCKLQPEVWQQVFHPVQIVLDGSFTSRKAQKWQRILTGYGFKVHNVQTDGAWIFPNSDS